MSITPTQHGSDSALIWIRSISKSYGGVRALADVSFDIRAGEVHALCGENGAGKTTLNHILSGATMPDSGDVVVLGHELEFGSVARAEELGISIVHQQPTAFPDMNTADNIHLMHETTALHSLWLDRGAMSSEAQTHLGSLGESFNVETPLRNLSLAQRQMVAIARAIARQCKLLILDEPTASLSRRESEALFATIRKLKLNGTSILFVSHRLEEVFELADRVTVLRDGRVVDTREIENVTRDELIKLMVGRVIDSHRQQIAKKGAVALEVKHLSKGGAFDDISFEVRSGEIVAITGLAGAGRSELARALFGVDAPEKGEFYLNGHGVTGHSATNAISNGLAYVPEDRHLEGLHEHLSVRENVAMAALRNVSRAGWLRRKAENALAESTRKNLSIKTESCEAAVASLSGGNQQKVLLGKWVVTNPRVLILDEPTHGIDIGAKSEVHKLIVELAGEGVAILLISSELPEVIALADRILVMRQGQIVAEFPSANATEQSLLEAALPQETAGPVTTAKQKGFVSREAGVAVILALTVIAAGLMNPRFFAAENIRDMLIHISPAVIVACGLTLVILAREIDISVGSLMGLCAAVLGIASSSDRLGLPPAIAAVACLGVGALGGLLNGVLVTMGRIPSIIVTLATLSVFRGTTEILLGGQWIQNIPPSLRLLGTGAIYGIPLCVIAAALIALLTAWLASRTPFGRRVYALGSNPKAAELIGIPKVRTKLALFTLTGLFVGIAALFSATQLQVIESGFGQGFELVVVAAVVVGGTSIMGGRGTIIGTLLGCALLGIVSTVLIFLRLGEMSTYWERAVQGAFVLAAVLADYFSRRKEAPA